MKLNTTKIRFLIYNSISQSETYCSCFLLGANKSITHLDEVKANLAASVSDHRQPTEEPQDHLQVPLTDELRSRWKLSFALVQQVERLINNSYCRCRGTPVIQSSIAQKGTNKYAMQCNKCLQRFDWSTIANEPSDLGTKAIVFATKISGISLEL